MSSKKWENVKIPGSLIERVQKIADKHGYATIPEFIRDAVREKLEKLEKLENSASEEVQE